MFIGHFAVGLAAKRTAPAVSLGVLFLACQFADLVWPTLLLAGLEHVEIQPGNTAFTPLNFVSYPYSHSLVALFVWGTVLAVVYRATGRATLTSAVLVAGVVISHWVLDAITHGPDVPLTIFGHTRVGLGLWNSIPATIAVETVMLIAGIVLYLRATRPIDRKGSIGFWSLIAVLVTINIANMAGPPPPSSTAVTWAAQGLWLFVIWGFWIDRHRSV